jgi:dihydrofolate reductase
MPRLGVRSFGLSLDGLGAGPHQDLDNPLGVGGKAIFDWFFQTETFQQMHGGSGGTDGVDNDFAVRGFDKIGAWILGRNMFGPIRGPTIRGKAGGVTSRRTTCPSSCSPITRAHRLSWKAERPFTL